jgi:hypothetical protein
MRLVFVLVGCLAMQQVCGQVTQPARWERELKFSDDSYSMISMQQEGLALVRDIDDFQKGKKQWEVLLLDTLLQQTWSTILQADPEYIFIGYEYTPGKLNLMFKRQGTDNILNALIFDVDLTSKTIKTSTCEIKLQIRLTHYTVADGNYVFGGYVGMEPVLIIYDPAKNKNSIVPGFFLTETELLDVRPNRNNTFNVLLAQRIAGKKKLIFRTFDKYGNILIEDEIPIDEGKTILNGASSVLEHDEVLIAGAFAFNSNKQASGVFSCLIDPFSEQPVLYTEFHQLQHFLDYLSDKKANRIRQKATERENYGKNPEYKTNVGIHRIEEFTNGFAVFGEAYLTTLPSSTSPSAPNPYANPSARSTGYPYSSYNGRYSNNPYLYQTSSLTADVSLLQGFVIGFDFKGRRLWDYTVPMNELKAPTREQVSDFTVAAGGVPHFLFKEESDLKFSNHHTDTLQTIEPAVVPIRLNSSFEESKSTDSEEGAVRQWYGHSFYVWGVANIKDSRQGIPTRRVFFINKVTLD